MDHEALPKSCLELGDRILAALDNLGLDPEGAFWLFDEEAVEWRLYVVSSLVDVAGPRWMFKQFNKILPEIVDRLPSTFDLYLVSSNEVLADEVREAAEDRIDEGDEPVALDFGTGIKNLIVHRIRPTLSVKALHRARVQFRKRIREVVENHAA